MYRGVETPEQIYDRLSARAEQATPVMNYWWAIAQVRGKSVVVGPASSEEEVSNMCLNRGADDFEAFELNTKSEQRATRMLKAIRLKRGASFERALERVGHNGKKGGDRD